MRGKRRTLMQTFLWHVVGGFLKDRHRPSHLSFSMIFRPVNIVLDELQTT